MPTAGGRSIRAASCFARTTRSTGFATGPPARPPKPRRRTTRGDRTMSLTFYTNPMSRGQTVRWMLEEVGEPYETEVLDYASTMKAEPYLSLNPMGKVPAVKHQGKVV